MKAARVSKDLSQDQLARMIGVSRQTINAIETGDATITRRSIFASRSAKHLIKHSTNYFGRLGTFLLLLVTDICMIYGIPGTDVSDAAKAVRTVICISWMTGEIRMDLRSILLPMPDILCRKTEREDTRYRAVKK